MKDCALAGPAGLGDGRAGHNGRRLGVERCGIPSTSRRATARQPRAQSWTTSAGGDIEGCTRERRTVGQGQVEGMPHRSRLWSGDRPVS